MTITSGRPRRSKALPLGITALVLLVLPMLALPLLFAVADPYLAVPVLGLLGVATTAPLVGLGVASWGYPRMAAGTAGALVVLVTALVIGRTTSRPSRTALDG